ncbi:MAG: glycosyltransferase family 4 protein [Pseudomonadota bacterium]
MTAVLHLLSSNGFHGAESVVLELCRGQNRLGRPAAALLLGDAGADVDDFRHRFAAAELPFDTLQARGRLDWQAVRSLRARLERDGTGILHSHKYKTTVYALLAARGLNVRVVATYHNWLFETRMLAAYAWLDKRLARYLDGCVAVSQAVLTELEQRTGASHPVLIHNGIDTGHWQPFERPPGAGSGPLVVGFVGRLSHDKGAPELFDALRRLAAVGERPVHGLFVGDGDLRSELEGRAREAGLEERVVFRGAVRDVAPEYRNMDVLVLPSRAEGLPMAVLEAMACGLPVVATDVGDVGELVRSGETGYLIPEPDGALLAEALRSLFAAAGRPAQLGAAARRLVETRFSTGSMTSRYEALYENLGCGMPKPASQCSV